MDNKVEICGVNTSKLPVYKDEQMKAMIEKIKQGDMETRDEFIKGNLRLVLSIIQRFGNRGENPDNLFQVGCIGLIKALDSIQEPVSLFEPVFHDDGDAIYVMDQVRDLKNTDAKWIESLSLSEAMKKLTPRERHILEMRFFEGKTQMEVAEEIAISQAQVSRLEKNALKYMRKYV